MSGAESIFGRFRSRAEQHPDKLLYAFVDVHGRISESYTYGEFLCRTGDIASHLQRRRAWAPGDRVLLAYPPGLELICSFFACVRIGLVPVPVYPPTGRGFEEALYKMGFIARDSGAAAVLTDRAFYWSLRINRVRRRVRRLSLGRDPLSGLDWIVSTDATVGDRTSPAEAHSDVAFLQYTSGSTSAPKGVMVGHDNLIDNYSAVVDHLPIGVSWLPQYHDMGLIGYYIFFAMEGGTTYGFSPLDFIQRPALWLETIQRFGATASSAPNFAYEYCLRPEKLPDETFVDLDLGTLRFLMTAAEPVRPSVYQAFLERFEPYGLKAKSFFAAYGLAEHTLAVTNYGRTSVSFDRAALGEDEVVPVSSDVPTPDRTTLFSCGAPLGRTEIEIVDVSGPPRAVGPGRVGEIWLRGPSKCHGYWGQPRLSADVFEATLDDPGASEKKWLRTGDLGFLHEGELFLCGRSKDLIIVRGLNYYPQDIEALVEQDKAVRKGCVAAFEAEWDQGDIVVVVAEIKRTDIEPSPHETGRLIQRRLGLTVDRVVYLPPRTIPKTSSGKIARHRVRLSWIDGTLAALREVALATDLDNPEALHPSHIGDGADTPAHRRSRGELAALFGRHGLTGRENWPLAEAGLDSLSLVTFSHDLKEHLKGANAGELARNVDVPVLQHIAVCELFELLEELSAAAPLARQRLGQALARLRAEGHAREQEAMRSDARLRFDPASVMETPPSAGHDGGVILLTGGTGFFGPFLLKSLLKQTRHDIYVLVRASDRGEGLDRLRKGIASTEPSRDPLPDDWESRVHTVCGDLSRSQLGLDGATWRRLSEEVEAIYHNGALVNYLLDYASMRDANVGGTNEIVRLAFTGRRKVVNHISTTFVFGWSAKEILFEADNNAEMQLLDFGYSQSKWVSEQVVLDAMSQGLGARLFRPALLTPSVEGGGENIDISIRLLSFMLRHGIGTTAANQVSFTPADIASDNIVAIAEAADSEGGAYHVTRDEYAGMLDVTRILGELTGRGFEQYSLEDFVPEVIGRCQEDDPLFPLLDFFVRSIGNITAMEFKRYDNSAYRQLRDASPFGRPDPPLADVVGGMLRFMRRQGLID